MTYIPSTEQVKCPCCNKYISIYQDIYLPDGCENDGRLVCLKCGTTVGYTWDVPEIFLPEYKDQKYSTDG